MGSTANLGDVTARLTLDTASFDAKLAASGQALDRHGELSEKASARARAAWEKELVAQEKAQRQLEASNRAKELAALKSDILSRSLEKEAASTNNLGHASVSQMQATSAAVRSLEGNPGIRAVERFLTTIPGVGKALQTAFPVIGAVAFGAAVLDGIEKVTQFIKTAREMPQTITQGFGSLNLSTKTTTDELQLVNDGLQNSIDKLEHKPQNNIAIAIDEARVAMDKFAASVEAGNEKIDALLAKNKVGLTGALLGWWGTKSTKGVEGTAKAFGIQENNQAFDLANATTPEQTAAAQKAMHDTQNARLAELRKTLSNTEALAAKPRAPNYQPVIADVKGEITAILAQQKLEAAEIEHAKLEAQNKGLEADKAAAEQAKQAAAKAATERLRAMEEALNLQKQQGNVSISYEFQYWKDRTAAFAAGSSEYATVVAKAAELAVAGARAAHEKIVRFQEQQKEQSKGVTGDELIARSTEDFRREAVKTTTERFGDYKDANQLSIVEAHNQAREREAQVMDAAGRSMTRYAAAVELAKIHSQEFELVQESLQANLDNAKMLQGMNPTKENARAVAEAQGAMVTAQTQRTIQSQADNDALYGRQTSALVASVDALDEFVMATRDTGRQIHELIGSALNGFNAQAVRALSGQKTSFGSFGAGLARDVAGTALQKGEGEILSMFGLGPKKKPSGTSGDPLYVRMADASGAGSFGGMDIPGVGKTGSSIGSMFGLGPQKKPSGTSSDPFFVRSVDGQDGSSGGFASLLNGQGSSSSTTSDGGGGVMGFLSGLLGGSGGSSGSSAFASDSADVGAGLDSIPFPMFADGVDNFGGGMAIVGEKGPELLNLPRGSGIVPNKDLGGVGGGATHNWNIDARGSNDPAAVRAQVIQGIKEAAPHIAASAVAATREGRLRSPSTQR